MIPIRWPNNWYYDQDSIRCIVPHCGFVSDSPSVENQWTQIHEHCKYTPGAEHGLLEIMLRQTLCAIDDCKHPSFKHDTPSYTVRKLFRHEKTAHGSAEMSNINSFVRLAREGRIRANLGGSATAPTANCEIFAFNRMMDKVQALPPPHLYLLFQKSGYQPDQHTYENLREILTHDPLKQPGDNPPYWWPVSVEHFLLFCRPLASDPVDWHTLWTDLREKYADGRI